MSTLIALAVVVVAVAVLAPLARRHLLRERVGTLTVRISLDTTAFVAAMKNAQRSFQAMGVSAAQATAGVQRMNEALRAAAKRSGDAGGAEQ